MNDVLKTFEALLLSTSTDDLYISTANISRYLGFEYVLHGFHNTTLSTSTAQFSINGCLEAWRQHYMNKDYASIDPIVRYCANHVIPIIWNDQLFNTPEAREVYREAREFGLMSGITFPIHGPGVKVSFLSLVSAHHDSVISANISSLFANGQLLACYVHEAWQRLRTSAETHVAKIKPLTAREEQCLLWAAAGKTAWEIGVILNITERTAVFHLANAAGKIGASNRRHAVARAVALGLIRP